MWTPAWAASKDVASSWKASWREAAAKTVTSPVMAVSAEAAVAGAAEFVESEAPPDYGDRKSVV